MMDFAWRNLTTHKTGEPLLGYFAPWPCCTVCEDKGDIDLVGRAYTRSTAATNLSGVGVVIPSFTLHKCSKCSTWHLQVTSMMTGSGNWSMRMIATDEDLDNAEKILSTKSQDESSLMD